MGTATLVLYDTDLGVHIVVFDVNADGELKIRSETRMKRNDDASGLYDHEEARYRDTGGTACIPDKRKLDTATPADEYDWIPID